MSATGAEDRWPGGSWEVAAREWGLHQLHAICDPFCSTSLHCRKYALPKAGLGRKETYQWVMLRRHTALVYRELRKLLLASKNRSMSNQQSPAVANDSKSSAAHRMLHLVCNKKHNLDLWTLVLRNFAESLQNTSLVLENVSPTVGPKVA